MHRLTNGRDPNFWSVRVNDDIRIIVHKTEASFMLAYVDHHDKAYAWAERRRIETHPRTGSIQIVEVHERIEEHSPLFSQSSAAPMAEPQLQPVAMPAPAIFAELTEDALLDVGVPSDWAADIRTWSEDRYFQMADRLPAEATEALFEYAATGVLPTPLPTSADPFAHPDTLRRVQTITSEEELRLALDFPWDKWSVFLHPSQREIADRDFSGPARVAGTAGTGKTIVALHRAARAVRNDPDARVLLSTFSRPLANALRSKLAILLGDNQALIERVSVSSFEDAASELYQLVTGRKPTLATADMQQAIVTRAVAEAGFTDLPARFVLAEWRQVVSAWNLGDLESYANVPRIGRRGRLGSKQREALWPVFEAVRSLLASHGLLTLSQLYAAVEAAYADRVDKPYTHVVVDEAQDLGVAELRMMSTLASGPSALFFAGDLGQRIFQLPFSWLALGVDMRGRSSSLKINYRTSRQIREAADQLLPRKVRDVDGMEDDRTGAQSVFEGPLPIIATCADEDEEITNVANFIRASLEDGAETTEIGVIVRSEDQLARARAAVAAAGTNARQLTERAQDVGDEVAVGTMHFAKGLEFKAVAVMACDDQALPLQSRIDDVRDEDELREVFDTERHLFYVACTRARDRLHISGVRPVSEFLDDLEA
jgi:superfamily I DNA/RNA helicase